MEKSLFFRFFAGVPMEGMDTFPLLPLGRWFLPIGIYLLIIGFYLGIDRKNRDLILLRYGNRETWWKHYFIKNLLYGGLTAGFLLFLGKMAEMFLSKYLLTSPGTVFWIFALWTVHGMLFLSFFLFLELTKIRKVVPSLLLFTEGITFLYGYRNKAVAPFMPGAWGMYAQSNFYAPISGFSAISVIVLQILGILCCYFLGIHLLKKKEMEGV
ncbi:MAG: hypothetical protein HFJ10_07840 [Lachnospiraceae bacterium]|nr:hypothetical protein [Lachnospiraceae bacterium]